MLARLRAIQGISGRHPGRLFHGRGLSLLVLVSLSAAGIAAREAPTDPLGSARDAFRRAEYERVVRVTQEILASRPNEPAASVLLGHALSRLGRAEEAEAILAGVIEREPGRFDGYVAMAEVYRRTERWTALEGLIDETVPLGPRVSGPTALAVLDQLSIAGRLEPAAGIARRMLEEDDDPVRRAGWAAVDSVGRFLPPKSLGLFVDFLEASPPVEWVPPFSDAVFLRLPPDGKLRAVKGRNRGSDSRDEGRVVLPRLAQKVELDYPRAVARRGIKGTAVVETVITRDGRVTRMAQFRSDHPVLTVLCMNSVRQWRFDPARNEKGEAIEIYHQVRCSYGGE